MAEAHAAAAQALPPTAHLDHLHPHPRSHSEAEAGVEDNHGISINLPDANGDGGRHVRSEPIKHMSAAATAWPFSSPIRHHKRAPSKSKGVKTTLNARSHYGSSDDDGSSIHRINQYIIQQEIGRGSFGSVHLAKDQYGGEYAVKEFSKSRLRKRAQSNLLRKPNAQRRPGALAAGLGFNSPLHRLSSADKMKQDDSNNSLNLIKEEIAIMKKLNHNNLVSLIEVLDDPQEDSLYMVLEMCKKGVVMKVGLDERAEPYEEEMCRCWFRDMILGIEYLHAQGIIHRDIKPDNCLITDDDVLKIVDFGVSEMFEKSDEMATAKSAGSPAFMPPELCVARHGQVSGKAVDIWSMGVTLYCLRYGHIPFEKGGMLELYDSIRGDEVPLHEEHDDDFKDLMRRLLEKEPEKRISMAELRDHAWVTKGGKDPLLSADENCADLVDPPTEGEVEHAITGNMAYLMVVMKAVKRFKTLLHRKRPSSRQGLFGRDSKLVAPPKPIRGSGSHSVDAHDRRPMESEMASKGVHRDVQVDDDLARLPRGMDRVHLGPAEVGAGGNSQQGEPKDEPQRHGPKETDAVKHQREEADGHRPHHASVPEAHRQTTNVHDADQSRKLPAEDHAKGQAHDPLTDQLYLSIGANPDSAPEEKSVEGEDLHQVVSESPPEVELNIYEHAYQQEINRILDRRGKSASMFLNRRVEHRDDLRSHTGILDQSNEASGNAGGKLAGLVGKGKGDASSGGGGGGGGLANLVRTAAKKQSEPEQPSKGSSEDCEDPPLQAPKLDGAKEQGDVNNVRAQSNMHAETEGLSQGSSDKSEDPSMAAPKLDGTQERVDPVEELAEAKAQAETDAQLDVAQGAMPGMPGAFPADRESVT